MSPEPESLILQLLRDMRAEIGDMRGEMKDMREQMATKDELRSLHADVASDLLVMRKELGEQIVGLRRAVIEYHSSTIGHGILISDLEARMRRVEQHLNLTPPDAH